MVGRPPKPNIRLLGEVVCIIVSSIVVFFFYGWIYDAIIPKNQPDTANILSVLVVIAFSGSYVALRWGDLLRKAKGILFGWQFKVGAITALAGLILIAGTYPYPSDSEQPREVAVIIRSETTEDIWVIEAEQKDSDWRLEIERDTLYLASATIIALATFGSLVTVRFLGYSKTLKTRGHGIILMFGGVIVVIVCQSILMYGACCGSINTMGFVGLFGATAVSLVSITIGFAMILESGLKDSSTPEK